MAENTIKKLEEELNCAICLETYKDPKLLQCFHIYCRDCLVRLVVRNQQGQLSLTCPTCRQATHIPANGVTGLQSAFRVNHLLEILEQHKKTKDTTASQESDTTHPIPSKKVLFNCSEHTGTEQELYCETCEDLICFKCAIKGGKHHDHKYHLFEEAFEKYEGEIAPSLEPMEGKVMAIKEALGQLDKHCRELSDQRETVEADIHDTFERLQETLNVRKTELISQLHEITQRKLKDLAIQRDQMETILAQLSSCLAFVRESLKTESQGEVLKIKSSIMNQVKELTLPFQADILKSYEEAEVKFSAPQDILTWCQNYGQVFLARSPDQQKSQTTNKHVMEIEVVAVVGKKTTANLQVTDVHREPYLKPINSLECELISKLTGTIKKGNMEHKQWNLYEISYQPTIKGKHLLSIKVEDAHIKGSPFSITAKQPVEKIGNLITSISGVKSPSGVVINTRGEVVVTELNKHCVSIFNPFTQALVRTFGIHGSSPGKFDTPWGVAVDGEGNILVADAFNHRIQKYAVNGRFLSTVGTRGEGFLQFKFPSDIAFNIHNQKLYVADSDNHRVQILNSDLTFSGSFGKEGSGKGQFSYLHGIACDNTGKVYVADSSNDRIQVFTTKGQFLKMFGKHGSSKGKLNHPKGIAIDGDVVYICDFRNHRVCIFTSEGRFITSFGQVG